jgi:hypothetical protein
MECAGCIRSGTQLGRCGCELPSHIAGPSAGANQLQAWRFEFDALGQLPRSNALADNQQTAWSGFRSAVGSPKQMALPESHNGQRLDTDTAKRCRLLDEPNLGESSLPTGGANVFSAPYVFAPRVCPVLSCREPMKTWIGTPRHACRVFRVRITIHLPMMRWPPSHSPFSMFFFSFP